MIVLMESSYSSYSNHNNRLDCSSFQPCVYCMYHASGCSQYQLLVGIEIILYAISCQSCNVPNSCYEVQKEYTIFFKASLSIDACYRPILQLISIKVQYYYANTHQLLYTTIRLTDFTLLDSIIVANGLNYVVANLIQSLLLFGTLDSQQYPPQKSKNVKKSRRRKQLIFMLIILSSIR